MRLHHFLLFALAGMAGCLQAAEKPNIIMILVDDMGWGDLSFNQASGAKIKAPAIMTPQLRKLADEGVQLTRHYTSAPVCAPARASLFGGVHQGHAEVIRNNSFDAALENSHTLASVLKKAGYATALIGKWGIGGGAESGGTPETSGAWPTARGFDYFFGYNNHIAGHRHYPKEDPAVDPDTHVNAIWDGNEVITDKLDNCYSTDLFTARAKKWIVDTHNAAPDKPFFLALTLIAPHARLAVPSVPYPAKGGLKGGVQWVGEPGHMINTARGEWDSFINPEYREAWTDYAKHRYVEPADRKKKQDILGRKLLSARRHATMVSRIDDAVGDIMQLVRDLKLEQNTFLVFLSDNGPHDEGGSVRATADHPAPAQDPSFFRSYGPLDGIKRDALEGGLRVPALVWAPGLVKKGAVVTRPGQFHDWMATFADLAGVPVPMRCDGVSLMPTLRGEGSKQREGVVYSEYSYGGKVPKYPDFAKNKIDRPRGEQQVIFFADPGSKKGAPRWLKAIRTGMKTGEEDFEIYDVLTDTHEEKNIASRYAFLQPHLKKSVLWNRRAYDYVRNPDAGPRKNPCNGRRPYDSLLVPPNSPAGKTKSGLVMRTVKADCPWVPAFDTVPGAAEAKSVVVGSPNEEELPAGSVTEFKGYINVPQEYKDWHFFLTLSDVPGTKAYIKMHNFQLIDADMNYKPGTTAGVSSAANTVERLEGKTGKKGIPLEKGLHEVTITVVQGAAAPGRMKLEWEMPAGQNPAREEIPAANFCHAVEGSGD